MFNNNNKIPLTLMKLDCQRLWQYIIGKTCVASVLQKLEQSCCLLFVASLFYYYYYYYYFLCAGYLFCKLNYQISSSINLLK